MSSKGGPSDWIGRRRLIEDVARTACGVGLAAGAVGLAATGGVKPAHALRPPGARNEATFLAACVKCGLCARACPYGTLRLATLGDGVAIGSPYFVARQVPCEMCDTIPCVVACPTGALDPALTDINKADMGVAALVGRETCLNLQGLRCDVCYRVCPAIDKAITLEATHNTRTGKHAIFEPVVHAEHCTGCGKCEKSCVLEETAIRVLPRELAQGRGGAHYRFGWREKDKAGAPLVRDIIKLPERLPEAKP